MPGKCKKGKRCGRACIPKNRTCRKGKGKTKTKTKRKTKTKKTTTRLPRTTLTCTGNTCTRRVAQAPDNNRKRTREDIQDNPGDLLMDDGPHYIDPDLSTRKGGGKEKRSCDCTE